MKTLVITLTALLSTGGYALATQDLPKQKSETCTVVQGNSTWKVDCRATHSIAKAESGPTEKKAVKPRLGFEGSPWAMPSWQ